MNQESEDDEQMYGTDEGRLTEKEVIAANVAWRVARFFSQLDGACYRSAMFLRLYLKERHGIEGEAIVGFVNDGESPVYASHASYEFEGKLTDIALSRPLDADRTPPGRLIIQGIVVTPGHEYTYHETVPEVGQALLKSLIEHPMFGEIIKDQEMTHAEASACANHDDLSRAYLNRAPDG